jgi:hypothetical protein
MKKSFLALLAGAGLVAAGLCLRFLPPAGPAPDNPVQWQRSQAGDESVTAAFRRRQSNLQVRGEGRVIKLLADDTRGLRHQRFILRLASGQTLLIVHNIDQAPRIDDLRPGDRVEFAGEYEWNRNGGLVHWTHRANRGRHPGGWLRHNGRLYH